MMLTNKEGQKVYYNLVIKHDKVRYMIAAASGQVIRGRDGQKLKSRTFALMLLGHLAPFLKGIREIRTFMVFTGGIRIAVMTVRLLIVLGAILQNIGTIFNTCTNSTFPVHLGKKVIYPFSGTGITENKENMSMTGLALVTNFITKTEVNQTFELLKSIPD